MTLTSRLTTPESISSGADQELSRVVLGRRALLFCRIESGALGLVTAELDPDENVVAVRGVIRIPPRRLDELEAALATARNVLEGREAAG
jgi:hypothetical protein